MAALFGAERCGEGASHGLDMRRVPEAFPRARELPQRMGKLTSTINSSDFSQYTISLFLRCVVLIRLLAVFSACLEVLTFLQLVSPSTAPCGMSSYLNHRQDTPTL